MGGQPHVQSRVGYVSFTVHRRNRLGAISHLVTLHCNRRCTLQLAESKLTEKS